MNHLSWNNTARPWPEGEPTRPGARCSMSDLLEAECGCHKHRGKKEAPDREPRPAEPFTFD